VFKARATLLEAHFMFRVLATVITIVNYDCNTFRVQAITITFLTHL
jgi:hypothetical protein